MSKHVFRFKQFDLVQEKSTQKMGTDTMLLGAWADPSEAMNILDIGTGTGVLALMMAQKNNEAIIDAVEPDVDSASEARENFDNSPWAFRLTCYPQTLQEFGEDETLHYDFIISNPPYFQEINTAKGNNRQHPEERRLQARTTLTLSYEDLLDAVSRLLVSYGTFFLVLPAQHSADFIEMAVSKGLFPEKRVDISSFQNEQTIRTLLALKKEKTPEPAVAQLFIYQSPGQWSEEYTRLTSAFHLLL